MPVTLPSIPGASIADNAREAAQYSSTHGPLNSLLWWANKVRPHGEWDYKFGNDNPTTQEFGNVNYGATGRALGVPTDVLLKGGGYAQVVSDIVTKIKTGEQNGSLDPTDENYGDAPGDQGDIGQGIDWSNENGVSRRRVGWTWNEIKETVKDWWDDAQNWFPRIDPLTLDLDGDGIETIGLNANNNVLFDHDGDGAKHGTGWVSADDAMLVLDRNNNGTIDNGRELFGDNTQLANGRFAADGFAALIEMDSNGDGKINADDTQFANLRLWRDINQDGVSQANELFTLGDYNIASINVAKVENTTTLANGNQIADLGTFTKIDGNLVETTGNMADVNLLNDRFTRQFANTLDTSSVATLPDMQACTGMFLSSGSGAVRDLREAANDATYCIAA